jgi:hypothetical protein
MFGPVYPHAHIAAFYRHRASLDWAHFAALMEMAGLYQMSAQ